MKRYLMLFFIFLLLAIAYMFISGNGVAYESTSGITDISPFSKDYDRLSKLYFIEQGELISETRTVNVENQESELAIVRSLKRGPKIESQEAPIGNDVNILSVITTDRISYVNLSSDFLIDDEALLYLNVMAIVNTLTEFESIDYVQVLVDGKKITTGEGIMADPLTKNTSLVQKEELQHKDIVKKFLEYVNQKRYDLAYDLIDTESKQANTFRDFKESAIQLNEEIKGYTQSYVFVYREQGRYNIQVKYVLRDTPSNNELLQDPNTPPELDYSWPMLQEDNVWKIKYFDY